MALAAIRGAGCDRRVTIRSHVRPDGRCVMWPAGAWTPEQAATAAEIARSRGGTALTTVDEAAEEQRRALESAGFVAWRREATVEIQIDTALAALRDARMPDGVIVGSAAEVDEDRLRLLDDKLRDDIPGTSGWRNSREDFHSDTFGDAAFHPDTYLVAVEAASGEYVGLVRVWLNREGPRIGMIGVRRGHRRRGIAAALLRQALEAAHALGSSAATTEFDVENVASAGLMRRLGAVPVRTTIEFAYVVDGS